MSALHLVKADTAIDEAPDPGLSIDGLKNAMACFGTGVTVITTHYQGQDWGMTCNSFNTVSLDPALVLWSIRRASQSHAAFESGGGYTVNILSAQQHDLAMRFTKGTQAERFAAVEAIRLPSGRLRLAGAIAWFDCGLERSMLAGDHDILLGRVLAVGGDEQSPSAPALTPLLYARRQFGQLVELPDLP
jgi:flavin reductase (DIM6/NTAB) family NADH-FMN oxidoreductase RutF